VTWRRGQMVLLSAQGMDVPAIAKVVFTSEDRVRDVIGNFNAGGFGSLFPKYKGGRPPKFTLARGGISRRSPRAKPVEYDLPFSAWSLSKLADFLIAEGHPVEETSRSLAIPIPLRKMPPTASSGIDGSASTGRITVDRHGELGPADHTVGVPAHDVELVGVDGNVFSGLESGHGSERTVGPVH